MPQREDNRAIIYDWITHRTPEGGRVLDLGCGDGALLAKLVEERHVKANGVELSESDVMKAIQRGLSVHHGNIDEGLDHYSDGSCDLVILSLTIQELGDPRKDLYEAFRVGKRGIIVFPNFGHFRARWQLGVLGQAPNTPSLPYKWYMSPNRHYLTVADWETFCEEEGWRIIDRSFVSSGGVIKFWPNLRAEAAMYLLEPKNPNRQ